MARQSWSGRLPSAATSSAALPASAAASACGTCWGSSPRATSVDSDSGGTNSAAPTRSSTGAPTAYHSSRSSRPEMTKPPCSAGATLSGWPSSSMASSSSAASSRSSRPPSTSARASTSPPTMAAEDEPRPRACGMALWQLSRSPVGCPPRTSKARRIARTTRWSSSRGTTPAPAPVTSTTRPEPASSPSSSSRRSRARPSESKPGPRFAQVAGTETSPDLHRSPAASAAAVTSASMTESTSGPNPSSAVAVSLRPCPVTVTTTVLPA